MVRLLIFIAAICVPTIVTAQEAQQKGESTISGRVIFADTEKPVRRATVHLFSNLDSEPDRSTPANRRGEFRFNEVPAGTYFVIAEASGVSSRSDTFALTEFGFSHEAEVEHTRLTVDGKGAARCDVRVVRGGTIRGTIVYPDKEPVTGAPISLFRRKSGVTIPFFVPKIKTNDRGMYRIDGLPPGEYFVGVVDNAQRHNAVGLTPSRGVVSAYYPGVVSITEAKAIQLGAGSDVSAISMTLADDELRKVSGVVKWRSGGNPVPHAKVSLRRKDEPRTDVSFDSYIREATAHTVLTGENMLLNLELMGLTVAPTVDANEKGEWTFEDLPPGKYVLTVYASLAERNSPKNEEEENLEIRSLREDSLERMVSRRIELTVADEDLKNVLLEISDGGRISGSVIADGSPVPPVSISVDPTGEATDSLMGMLSKEDGSFLLEGIPGGDVRLEVTVAAYDQADLYVKSVTLGNLDLLRNPLRVEEGAEVTGVRITLGRGLAKLTGRVRFNEGGSLAGGSGVMIIKADPALWQSPSARMFTLTNAAGEFELQWPPGDYLVFTWAPGNQPVQSVAEYLRTHGASARRITLQSGEEKQIELTGVKPKNER